MPTGEARSTAVIESPRPDAFFRQANRRINPTGFRQPTASDGLSLISGYHFGRVTLGSSQEAGGGLDQKYRAVIRDSNHDPDERGTGQCCRNQGIALVPAAIVPGRATDVTDALTTFANLKCLANQIL
jgi:hypothetical protein